MSVCATSRCTKRTIGRAIFCPECRKKSAKPSTDPTRKGLTMPSWAGDFIARQRQPGK